MTHKKLSSVPKIALYEPDIPQNTAAIARTCSCLGAILEIIEPCGFLLNDKRFKRVVMDYLDQSKLKVYKSSDEFFGSVEVSGRGSSIPCITDLDLLLLEKVARVREVTINKIAIPVVNFVRKFPAPLLPNIV